MADAEEHERSPTLAQSTSNYTNNHVDGNAKVQLGDRYKFVTNNYHDRYNPAKWLSAPDVESDQRTAQRKHVSGTGTWLLESEQYVKWTEGEVAHLWIYGFAGCGKTVLFSTVAANLRQRTARKEDFALAAYYFSFADTGRQSYHSLLSSVVAQLSRGDKGRKLLEKFRNKASSAKASTEELEDVFEAILELYQVVYLCIDAIDECPEENDARELLLDKLQELTMETPKLKFFLSSRELPSIRTAMEDIGAQAIAVGIEKANHDIAAYLEDELHTDRKLRSLDQGIKTLIQDRLSAKANGMFRWAFCQLQSVKKLRIATHKHVEQHLSKLPPTLDETYERMLWNICQLEECDQQVALTILTWLVVQARPMAIVELIEVCVIDIFGRGFVEVDNRSTPENLIELLAELVTVYRERPAIRILSEDRYASRANGATEGKVCLKLAHFSVQEYLTSGRLRQSVAKFAIMTQQGHRLATQSCLLYLEYFRNETMNQTRRERLQEYPLVQYAGAHWVYHSRLSSSDDLSLEVEFLSCKTSLRSWCSVCELYPEAETYHISGASGLYCASYFGLENIVQQLCYDGAGVNAAEGAQYTSALHIAVHRRHVGVARILLDYGADGRFRQGSEKSPLQLAVSNHHTEMADMLMAKGADPNVRLVYQPLLHSAVTSHDFKMLRLLLDNGADPDLDDDRAWTALHVAARNDEPVAARLLLTAGADPDKVDAGQQTPLHIVAQYSAQSSTDVADLLLSAGASPNVWDQNRSTPLQFAVQFQNHHLISRLLTAGARPIVSRHEFDAYLATAVRLQDTTMIKQFLKAGANPDFSDIDLYTPLHRAICSQNTDLVRLLLDHGANVNLQTADNETAPLHLAANYANVDLFRLLLDHGADFNARNMYETVLHRVVKNHMLEMLRPLLCKGGDINARDAYGETVLQLASKNQELGMLRLLLDKGADVNAPGPSGRTALHLAVKNATVGSLRLLLDSGADLNLRDDEGQTAVHHAAKNADIVSLRLLLDRSPEINAQNLQGRTALHLAVKTSSRKFNIKVLRLILDRGANEGIKDKDGRTALDYAILKSRRKAADLLLGKRANSGVTEKNGSPA